MAHKIINVCILCCIICISLLILRKNSVNYTEAIVSKSGQCTHCRSMQLCSYIDEDDLRVMVLVYNRIGSLRKCLAALQDADISGVVSALEIWIDISLDGQVDHKVLQYAESFKWRHGRTCVHIQDKHVNVAYQWIYSWRPREGSREIGLIVEDDVDLSRYFFRYLRGASAFYYDNTEIFGICLYDETCLTSSGPRKGKNMIRPSGDRDIVFLYGLMCGYGYAPVPHHWRAFQDWFQNVSQMDNFDPTAKETSITSGWYRGHKRRHKADEMLHEAFIMRYKVDHKLYTLHPNLQVLTPRPHSLATHRKEKGLHLSGKNRVKIDYNLKIWKDEFIKFPKKPKKYDWSARLEKL